MTTLPIVYNAAKSELEEILDAGARALRPAGLDLLPIKRAMLKAFPLEQQNLILDACNLLFAAVLAHENALWQIGHASNPLDLVAARLEAGKARGVVHALFYGQCAPLLVAAMNHAPIAFYAISEASPTLDIVGRVNRTLNSPH